MMGSTTTRAFATTCTGLAAGVLLGHWRGVSAAVPQLEPASFIQLQQVIHVQFVPMMPILLFGATTGAIAWAFMLRHRRSSAVFWLVAASAAAMAVVLGMTLLVNVPINRELMTWRADAPPGNLALTWSRWEASHSLRTVLALAAFVLQMVGLSTEASRKAE